MKIGILTHQYINNFGAFLQAYALQQAVKELYPNDEVMIINYVNLKHFIINTGGWFRFYKNRENLKSWLQKIRLPFTFYKARHKYMNLTKFCFTTKAVNNMNFDYIIVGSDEVWNYKDSKSNAAIKFGCGLKCKNLIAYAPSVGKTEANENMPEYVKKGIGTFKAVSARDDLTQKLIENIYSGSVTRVLDPTFLSEFPKEEMPDIKKPYILFYYCEKLPEEKKKEIFDFAAKNGLAVYGGGECDKDYTDVTVNLSPFQWSSMFKNAEYVITGTFHGAVFSILNRKKFVCYLTNESRIKKVGSLLKEMGLEDRRAIDAANDFVDIMTRDIDYLVADITIDTMVKESREFIKRNIREK